MFKANCHLFCKAVSGKLLTFSVKKKKKHTTLSREPDPLPTAPALFFIGRSLGCPQ